MAGAKWCVKLERLYKVTLQNYHPGVAHTWLPGGILDTFIETPPDYHHCTSLEAIWSLIPSTTRPSVVQLEGPICNKLHMRMPTGSSSRERWSHPFAGGNMHSERWFCPDMVEVASSSKGTRPDVACLMVIQWHLMIVDRKARDGRQYLALAAGIILVECSGGDGSEQSPGERIYFRIGYFEHWFRSPDFSPRLGLLSS